MAITTKQQTNSHPLWGQRLMGSERRSLNLPEGAVVGQDRDTLDRARGR